MENSFEKTRTQSYAKTTFSPAGLKRWTCVIIRTLHAVMKNTWRPEDEEIVWKAKKICIEKNLRSYSSLVLDSPLAYILSHLYIVYACKYIIVYIITYNMYMVWHILFSNVPLQVGSHAVYFRIVSFTSIKNHFHVLLTFDFYYIYIYNTNRSILLFFFC